MIGVSNHLLLISKFHYQKAVGHLGKREIPQKARHQMPQTAQVLNLHYAYPEIQMGPLILN